MGNSTTSTTPLPNLWTRLNHEFLKNINTQDIIQEHQSIHPSQQQQLHFISQLKQRISLHHPHILKVIYYKNNTDQSFCNSILSKYITYSYTEYHGPNLYDFRQDEANREVEIMPLSQIVTACQYLRVRYGSFKLSERMIFVGRQRQKSVKIWMNSRVQLCQAECPTSEEQMCRSLCQIVQCFKQNKLTKDIDRYELQFLKRMTSLKQMKAHIVKINGQHKDEGRQKKANSMYVVKRAERPQEGKLNNRTNIQPAGQLNIDHKNSLLEKRQKGNSPFQNQNDKNSNNKVNFSYQSTRNPHLPVSIHLAAVPLLRFSSHSENIAQRSFSSLKIDKITDNSGFHSHFSGKVRFAFTDRSKHKQTEQPIVTCVRQQKQQVNIDTKPLEQQKKKVVKKVNFFIPTEHKTLFSPHIGTYAMSIQNSLQNSLSNSPSIPKAVLDQPLLIRQKPQFQIKPDNYKQEKPAVLATTSRSPHNLKDNLQQQTRQAQKRNDQKGQRRNDQKGQRRIAQEPLAQKHSSTFMRNAKTKSVANNKFDRFKNAIKRYQERLKQKIKASGGNLNKKRDNNATIVITSVQSPSKKQYTQTKSLYNDSSKQAIGERTIKNAAENEYFIQMEPQVIVHKPVPNTKNLTINVEALCLAKSKQMFQQVNHHHSNSSSSQFKNEYQAQIQGDSKGLLTEQERKSLIKQQYQSIRQKVKQKKQTFAQLKAEAAKILQDFNFD